MKKINVVFTALLSLALIMGVGSRSLAQTQTSTSTQSTTSVQTTLTIVVPIEVGLWESKLRLGNVVFATYSGIGTVTVQLPELPPGQFAHTVHGVGHVYQDQQILNIK